MILNNYYSYSYLSIYNNKKYCKNHSFENFTFSQMTLMEITRLNSTGPKFPSVYTYESTKVMPRDYFHLSCMRKLKNYVARQDPRYGGPEEGKDAKRTYSIKACTAKMD